MVATPASTTGMELAERFGSAQLAGVGELVCRVIGPWPAAGRAVLRAGPATIDLDSTDVESHKVKEDGTACSDKGARAGRPRVATWAEAGLGTAADLLAGDADPAAGLIGRGVATLPAAGVTAQPRVRGVVGHFAGRRLRSGVSPHRWHRAARWRVRAP